VRGFFFWIFLITAAGLLRSAADDKVVQEFSGSGSTTTGFFKIHDRWEVRWNSRQVVSVAVMSSDGTIVAGGAGVLRGSLFVPLGGQFYFKIVDGTIPSPADTNSAPAKNAQTNAAASPEAPPVSWHLQVVELGPSVNSDQALTVYTPFFVVPDSAINPVPAPVPPPKLTMEQSQSTVVIKGDRAVGTGFLVHMPDGFFVATHLHLLAANPNIIINSSSGTPITVLSLKGAADRDLAMLAVKDDHYSYLPVADAAAVIAPEDVLIVPDIGQQLDPLKDRAGKVLNAGIQRIDFEIPLNPSSDGAPVIHVKSNKVVAIVSTEKKFDVSEPLVKAWTANTPPDMAQLVPYYGLRLTGVNWETYDQTHFLTESLLLQQFHTDTRCLDSYLNGRRHRGEEKDQEGKPPDNRYFLNNPKLRSAQDNYKQFANGADQSQRLEASRELIVDLQRVADTGLNNLKGMSSHYSFDQNWIKEEVAYRMALKKELDDLENNINRLDNIARSH
jgi:hypothetical protein